MLIPFPDFIWHVCIKQSTLGSTTETRTRQSLFVSTLWNEETTATWNRGWRVFCGNEMVNLASIKGSVIVSVSRQLPTSTYYRPLEYGDVLCKCLVVSHKCVVSERPFYFQSVHCVNCTITLCWLWIWSVGQVHVLQILERPTLIGATIRQKQQKMVLAVMQELRGTAALYYPLV